MPGRGTGTLNEFLTDTMRTIYSLLATGAATRYGDIRFIFSHAGGTMPSLIERFGIGQPGTHNDVFARPAEPNSKLYHLRRFYYDTANSCNTVQLQGLKTIVGASQIVFGSDCADRLSEPCETAPRVAKVRLQRGGTCGYPSRKCRAVVSATELSCFGRSVDVQIIAVAGANGRIGTQWWRLIPAP